MSDIIDFGCTSALSEAIVADWGFDPQSPALAPLYEDEDLSPSQPPIPPYGRIVGYKPVIISPTGQPVWRAIFRDEPLDDELEMTCENMDATDMRIENTIDWIKQSLDYNRDIVSRLHEIKLRAATGTEIAFAILVRYYKWLVDTEQSANDWSKYVAEHLFAVPASDGGVVDIFQQLFAFIRTRSLFKNAPFAFASFDARVTMVVGDRFDRDYDISQGAGNSMLADAKPMDLFRAFRSIVSRSVMRITKSYDTPDFEKSATWSYRTPDREEHAVTPDLLEFMRDYATIFVQLERLPKSLDSMFAIFNNARS